MAASIDPTRAAQIESAVEAFSEAHNARDWDRVRALLADDFALADHRPAGFGWSEGADAYVAVLKSAVELVPDRRLILNDETPGAPAGVRHWRAEGTDEFGGAVDWDFYTVWGVRDGRLTRVDVFTFDDYEAAVRKALEVGDG